MIAIRREIEEIELKVDPQNNVLKNAPHTAEALITIEWQHSYSVSRLLTPLLREHKFWPAVGRIDNAFGDRNFCSCLPMKHMQHLILIYRQFIKSVDKTRFLKDGFL